MAWVIPSSMPIARTFSMPAVSVKTLSIVIRVRSRAVSANASV